MKNKLKISVSVLVTLFITVGAVWAAGGQRPFTTGAVLFSNGTSFAQDSANFFWDNTNKLLGINGTVKATQVTTNSISATGSNQSIALNPTGTGVVLSNLSSDPASGQPGQIYFNTVLGKFRGYNGTTWVTLLMETPSPTPTPTTSTITDCNAFTCILNLTAKDFTDVGCSASPPMANIYSYNGGSSPGPANRLVTPTIGGSNIVSNFDTPNQIGYLVDCLNDGRSEWHLVGIYTTGFIHGSSVTP